MILVTTTPLAFVLAAGGPSRPKISENFHCQPGENLQRQQATLSPCPQHPPCLKASRPSSPAVPSRLATTFVFELPAISRVPRALRPIGDRSVVLSISTAPHTAPGGAPAPERLSEPYATRS